MKTMLHTALVLMSLSAAVSAHAGKAEPTFAFSGNKSVATTDVSSYPSWDMMTAAIDR